MWLVIWTQKSLAEFHLMSHIIFISWCQHPWEPASSTIYFFCRLQIICRAVSSWFSPTRCDKVRQNDLANHRNRKKIHISLFQGATLFDLQHVCDHFEDMVQMCLIHGPRKMDCLQRHSFAQQHFVQKWEWFRSDQRPAKNQNERLREIQFNN